MPGASGGGAVVTETQAVDLARKVSINATVYGGADGAVAFLDMPDGVISPPYIAHMVRLGDVPSVITQALRASRPPLQRTLADHLGVLQQSISRWTEGTHPPELTSEQWARVVKLVFTEWDGEKWR